MADGFVWLHNDGTNAARTRTFYSELLGWAAVEGPGGMACLAGETGPFAEIREAGAGTSGWVPYAQVDDVDAATRRAVELGARIVADKTRGPAGDFTILQDPGGASVALWQKA
jgi:predicted enzyme related to lactoylglutathione lyase